MTRFSKISCAVQLLHVSVALNLRLVTVDTTFDLTCEGKEVLVDDLGGLAVPLVFLGQPDVLVHKRLRLEPHSTALIGAGKWSLAGVVHPVEPQAFTILERSRAARVSAGESWRLGVQPADVALQVVGQRKGLSTIFFFADEPPLSQVHGVVVAMKVSKLIEGETTNCALVSAFA